MVKAMAAITAAAWTATGATAGAGPRSEEQSRESVVLRGEGDSPRFGVSVAVAEGWILVGDDGVEDGVPNPGAVECFARNEDGAWKRIQRFGGIEPRGFDRFGAALDADGGRVIVGSPGHDLDGTASGRAEVWRRDGDRWSHEATLRDPDAAALDEFGSAVAIKGDRALVAAPRADAGALDSGRVVLFERRGAAWHAVASLSAPDGGVADWFGHAVDLDEGVAVIGAHGDDDQGEKSGAAWVFEPDDSGGLIPVAKLLAPDGARHDWFGFAVAVSGGLIAVGSPRADDHGESSGSLWIFGRDEDAWRPRSKVPIRGASGGEWIGYSLALRGRTLLVGAPGRDRAAGEVPDVGVGAILRRRGGRWEWVGSIEDPNARAERLVGSSTAVDGDLAVVGHRPAEDLVPIPGEVWARELR